MTQTRLAYKNIGILGGMGAAASSDFYQEIVKILQHEYHAEQDTDFPPMFIYNLPLAGFDETGFADENLVKEQLVAGVKKIEAMGSDFIVIPCNTVHHFYETLSKSVGIPILSIIEATVDEALRRNYKKIGLLTSESTRRYGLYESVLKKRGLAFLSVSDEEQSKLNSVVHHAIGGTQGVQEVLELHSIISRLQEEGADTIVLGCTELPLVISQEECPLPLLNSTSILAETAVRYSLG